MKEEVIEKTLNCTEVLSDSNYEDHHENCTLYDNYNVTVPDLDENQNLRFVSLHQLVTKDQKQNTAKRKLERRQFSTSSINC